jgi:hypothetical protein
MPPVERVETESRLRVMQAGTEKGLKEYQALKEEMDKTLLEHRYGKWSRFSVTFNGPLCLAITGTVAPNRDFNGNELQILHDPEAAIESIAFGVVATDFGGAFVAIWKAADKIPRRFIESLIRTGDRHLGNILAQFILLHVENTYFSCEWWNGLDMKMRNLAMELVSDPHPYYSNRRFESVPIVPWQVVEVTLEDGAF